MDSQQQFRTSSVVLTSAMMLLVVLALFMILPAIHGRPANGHSAAGQANPAIANSADFSETSSGQQLTPRPIETTVNASFGSNSVKPVVVSRSVNVGHSRNSTGRETETPEVYVPVTVHPVTVNVDGRGDQGTMLTSEIARLSHSLEQLLEQKKAAAQNFETGDHSALKAQPDTQDLSAIQEQLNALELAVRSLQQTAQDTRTPPESEEQFAAQAATPSGSIRRPTEFGPAEGSRSPAISDSDDDAFFSGEVGMMSPILDLDELATSVEPLEPAEGSDPPASGIVNQFATTDGSESPVTSRPQTAHETALQAIDMTEDVSPLQILFELPDESPPLSVPSAPDVAPVPPAEHPAACNNDQSGHFQPSETSAAPPEQHVELTGWQAEPTESNSFVGPVSGPQIRPIDESRRSMFGKSVMYLKSRPWLPDLDMPQWMDHLPGKRLFSNSKSAAPSNPSRNQLYAQHVENYSGVIVASPASESPVAQVTWPSHHALSAQSAPPPMPPVPPIPTIRQTSHQVVTAIPSQSPQVSTASQVSPPSPQQPVVRYPASPPLTVSRPETRPTIAPQRNPSVVQPRPSTPFAQGRYVPSHSPGTPLKSLIESAPVHRITSALRFASRPQTVQ